MIEEYPNRRRGDEHANEAKPRNGWEVALRNRTLIIACIALAVVAGLTFTALATRVYEAETSIRIDREEPELRVNRMLDNLSQSGEVSTEMEVLRSRVLAEEVVDSLGLQVEVVEPRTGARSELLSAVRVERDVGPAEYILRRSEDGVFRVLDGESGEERARVAPGGMIELEGARLRLERSAAEHDELRLAVRPFAQAVERLRRALEVARPNADANVVTVRYESPDTQLVREVPNALAGAFIERRQDVKSMEARSRVRFLGEQIDAITAQLTAAEEELREFQEAEQIASLAEEARTRVDRLVELQAERNAVEVERAALARLLEDVRATEAARGPDDPSPYRRLLGFPSMLRNPSASQLLGSLTEVENERTELLKQRMEEDPDVRILTNRITQLETQIHDLATTYLEGLRDQARTLDSTLAAYGGELAGIPRKQVELARLERQTEILGEIYTLLQTRLKEAEIAAATRDQSIRVVDPAIRPVEPVRPRAWVNLMLAGLLGLLVGFVTAVTREVMDTTVHTERDVEEITGVPVLGLIPRIREAETARPTDAGRASPAADASRLITDRDPANPVSEAYRALRTNVTFARPGDSVQTLLITSPMPTDGKTTSAANLAVTFALQGQRVALVDADLRRGALFEELDAAREPGISNVALGSAEIEDAVQEIEVGDDGVMHFVSTGTLPPNPSELLASQRVEEIIARLEERFDVVVIDSPPVNVVTDAALLSRHADGVLVVARADSTERQGLRHAVEQLRNVQARLVGAVLNDITYARGGYGRGYGGYGPYHYAYDAVERRRAMPARIAARLGWDRLPWTNG